MGDTPLASLSLTHVHYVSAASPGRHLAPSLIDSAQNPEDPLSFLSAWFALIPQALCVSYATLVWSTREVEVILMFAGQLACEGLNFLLKRIIKEERPKRESRADVVEA